MCLDLPIRNTRLFARHRHHANRRGTRFPLSPFPFVFTLNRTKSGTDSCQEPASSHIRIVYRVLSILIYFSSSLLFFSIMLTVWFWISKAADVVLLSSTFPLYDVPVSVGSSRLYAITKRRKFNPACNRAWFYLAFTPSRRAGS